MENIILNNIKNKVSKFKHQNNNNSNVSIDVIKTSSISKKYECKYCKKILSSRQSKWRHVKTCDKKTELEERLEKVENKLSGNNIFKREDIIKILDDNISVIQNIYKIIDQFYFNKTYQKSVIAHGETIVKSAINNYINICNNIDSLDSPSLKIINQNIGLIKKLENYKITQIAYSKIINELKYIDSKNDEIFEIINNGFDKYNFDSDSSFDIYLYIQKN